MREIKFRAWYENTKRMYMVHGDEMSYYFGSKPDGVILMQYTGLKDRKDNEIYEGDIVEHFAFTDHIIFRHGYYCFSRNDTQTISQHVLDEFGEVIGNIYEHPHLLPQAIEPTEQLNEVEAEQ